MEERIKVSIIIPVYNAEKYIGKCLDSAVSQTIASKEIICIDDGSKDNSYSILEKYQEKYSCIKIFRQNNKGAGEARNVGLENAVGIYVSFLDSDDFYLDPEALEKMVYVCENEGMQACGGLRKILEEGVLTDHFLYREYFESGKNLHGVVMRYRDCQDDYFYQNYIFSMQVIKRNNILFPSYRRYQDAPFFLKTMLAIDKYKVLPIEFYGYRSSAKALSRKGTYIEDLLKGIRDNALTAVTYHLDELKKILAYRIADEYSSWIINGTSNDILQLLFEIQEILFGRICMGEESENIQENSFEIVRSIAAGNLKGNNLGSYFEKKGITSVAVYGLGLYGKMAVAEIKKSKKVKIYGVDQKVKQLEGVEIGNLSVINEICDMVIVTPAKDNYALVKDIQQVWTGNVCGLYELVHEVESEK